MPPVTWMSLPAVLFFVDLSILWNIFRISANIFLTISDNRLGRILFYAAAFI